MLQDDDDILGSGFMNAGPSASFNAPIATFDINPWGGFPVADPTVEEEGLAAANILGLTFSSRHQDTVTNCNLKVGVDLPEIYDNAYIKAAPMGDRVSVANLEKILRLGGVPFQTLAQIKSLVVMPGSLYVTRNEFNTALALVACSQKNMGTSLDIVKQHRNDLPVPVLSNLERFYIERQAVSEKQEEQLRDPWHQPAAELPSLPVGLNGQTTSSIKEHGVRSKLASDNVETPIESQTWFQHLDDVTVEIAPEKEGFIFFKHVNYIVQSQQHGSTVLRRFSDFYWLWEILLLRYPYRMIPNVPAKRLGGRDDAFLERRRKALARFINSVVAHPVVGADEIVRQFLTERSELSLWRRENPPNTDEEFVRKMTGIDHERTIPNNLDERLDKVKKKLPILIQNYQSMYQSLERMIRLEEHRAADLVRYSDSLSAVSELNQTCYVPECQSCEQVTSGCRTIANSIAKSGSILGGQAKATSLGILDRLKRHWDLFMSFQQMLERIQKTVPIDKSRDGDNAASDHKRQAYVRYCAASELSYLHKQQAFILSWYQNYVQEQLKYERQHSENWKSLEISVQDMPADPGEFV
ncbi:Sorting nexin mvp1 [Apophysomyces ossiformis]|uniref:Sorting nexin MVP1 n=1 Tax=Apophysomyces ossiformis TaxID=679940 RepID=A0A8H7ELU6_9FUNG|nr:Sorting nexin mvp1 [Apophysomyces ossiformis]